MLRISKKLIAPPTAQEVRALFDYDPLTGHFTRKSKARGRYGGAVGSVAGTVSDQGYILISVRSKQYRAHRLAWLYMTGEWPSFEVDHRNGKRTENWWKNLRDATPVVNQQNQVRAKKHSKTGLLGASWSKKDRRFVARIRVDGRYLYLGGHDTAEKAHLAYVEAKRRLHAGCTI